MGDLGRECKSQVSAHAYASFRSLPLSIENLKLRLLRLSKKIRHESIANIIRSFINIETHPLGTEVFADDVELQARSKRRK